MNSIHRYEMAITTDAAGSANFKTPQPLSGEILSIRLDGTALNQGGTADMLLRRAGDNGTILSLTDFTSPWQFQPRDTLHTLSGGSALPASSAGVPIDGYLECIVGSARGSAQATVHIYYRR